MNNDQPPSSAKWIYDSPVNSEVEAKLRRFLVELGNADKILGIQICAYKDGKVIIDTAGGVLGVDDPRPVQPDSLFPVFSTTKGITTGMIHWLADKGKLKLDDYVANIWPGFGTNGKDQIKVNHILTHTAGLHNVLANFFEEVDPALFCDFDECLKRIVGVAPETEPGRVEYYHYLSYGWLCAGIIQHASGEKFQDVLEKAFVRPLNVEGEFYIGIPPGVESRLATLTISDLSVLPSFIINAVSNFITISNTLDIRRAIIPSANGHFSARALARYYATLLDGGVVPPARPPSLPPLGSHPHNPLACPLFKKTDEVDETKIFTNSKEKIHDAFLGRGDYKNLLSFPDGMFGLGFMKMKATDGSIIGFGQLGLGGSTGHCDINNKFVIAMTVNKLSMGPLTGDIIRFICSELDLLVPQGLYEGSKDNIENLVMD